MIRAAVAADLPRLLAIRDAAGADALSDPTLLSEEGLRRLIDAGTVEVWDEAADVAGFTAVAGAAIHLLVDPARRDRGIGRALLAAACEAIKQAGKPAATVSLAPGSGAERHYRAAGWSETGRSAGGGSVLKKPF